MRTLSAVPRDAAASRAGRRRAIPAELANILGTCGALLAVVAAGAGISAALPESVSPWLFAAAYGAPAAVAFAVYWWIDQRL
ncbi:hypothetical protein LJR225_000339 [Phenylobacterium sp. LjRoot225]|uniref:hypothetical protein n=1 Tax=Phenylobacterium sp. LjRoot225 TaxID=3342285 RepID=UPI003ECD028D